MKMQICVGYKDGVYTVSLLVPRKSRIGKGLVVLSEFDDIESAIEEAKRLLAEPTALVARGDPWHQKALLGIVPKPYIGL